MNNLKLLQLIKRITAEEWKSFGLFLKSPYHNSNKKIVQLYQLLSKYHPLFESPRLTKEKFFNAIFSKDKSFDQQQLANLMSQFIKKTKRFFVIQQLEKQPQLEHELLGAYYGSQNWFDLFEKYSTLKLKKLKEQEVKSKNEYLDVFTTIRNHYLHPKTQKAKYDISQIENALDNLNIYYSLEQLKLRSQMLSKQDDHSNAFDFSTWNLIKEIALLTKDEQCIFFVKLNALYEEYDFSKLPEIENYFFKKLNSFNKKDQRDVFISLLNLKNREVQFRDKDHQKKPLFQLYKKGIKYDLLIENNILVANHFSNIVLLGALNKKITWTREFIKKHQSFLKEDGKENLLNQCEARLLFEEERYEEASDLLISIQNIQTRADLNAHNLNIKCLYELYLRNENYYDLLVSRVQSFEKTIRRKKKWNEEVKKSYLLFCKIVLKLSSIKNIKAGQEKKEIINELETQPVISKKWILQKINQG